MFDSFTDAAWWRALDVETNLSDDGLFAHVCATYAMKAAEIFDIPLQRAPLLGANRAIE